MNRERRRIAARYLSEIHNPALTLPYVMEGVEPVWHIFAVRCRERDRLAEYLGENGISTNKHYPIPMHLQVCYADLEITAGALPIAEEISATELSLPMYYGMTDDEVKYVVDVINQFVR